MDYLNIVKDHAIKNYERGGWDFVIECYSDAEITKAIGNAKTERGAIRNVAEAFGIALHDQVRKDIQGA